MEAPFRGRTEESVPERAEFGCMPPPRGSTLLQLVLLSLLRRTSQ